MKWEKSGEREYLQLKCSIWRTQSYKNIPNNIPKLVGQKDMDGLIGPSFFWQ